MLYIESIPHLAFYTTGLLLQWVTTCQWLTQH